MKRVAEITTKTVLCSVDFSKSTKASIAWAVAIAHQMDAHLTILYTYRLLPSQAGEVVMVKKAIEEKARQRFSPIEKECLSGKGVSYDFKIEVGFISDRIEYHSRQKKLNLIIMDKQVRGNNNENLEELMEHVDVPLLLVP